MSERFLSIRNRRINRSKFRVWLTSIRAIFATRINLCGLGGSRDHGTAIDMLPDDVLVEIFDACRMNETGLKPWKWKWARLVHVCRRWRQIVLSYLNVQLFCTHGTLVAKKLACWPTLPIALEYGSHIYEDHLLAALEYPDRIRRIEFWALNLRTGKVAKAMQKPCPALTHLILRSGPLSAHTIPHGFLGGSAPRLQEIALTWITFLELPTLLLKAHALVNLEVSKMPWNGFLSPEKIIKSVATATRLQSLRIGYSKSCILHVNLTPLTHHLPPITRTVLPSLTSLRLEGARDFLEDFVARVDVPRLRSIDMTYLHQNDLRVPELLHLLMERSEGACLSQFNRAGITLHGDQSTFHAYPRHEANSQFSSLKISISGSGKKRCASHMIQFHL